MNIYGTVKPHSEQRKIRLMEVAKSCGIYIVLSITVLFLLWVYFDINLGKIMIPIIGVPCIWIAIDLLKDLKKVKVDDVAKLLAFGEKNTVFVNTINCMLEKNGSLNFSDLKGLQNEMYWANLEIKRVLDLAAKGVIVGSQNDKNMAATYIEYENNNSIIEQIKKVISK